MNLLLLTGMAACGVLLLWTTQSVALAAIGEPLAWPLRTRTDDVRVKWTRRVGVQAVWGLLLVGFPWAAGSSPVEFFTRVFPPPDWAFLVQAGALCLALMFAAYLIEIRVGWVRWAPQHTGPVRRAKLFRRFLTPVPLAIMEEAVFRGTLLEQIAGALPDGRAGAMAAIVASSVAFSL